MKKRLLIPLAIALFLGAAFVVQADDYAGALVVTASNAATNQLLVYDTADTLLQTVATGGKGGVSGNAGGIAVSGDVVAVVNFGSKSVSLLERSLSGFQLLELIPTASSPVSVAIGNDHLYILGTTTVESHEWRSLPGYVFVDKSADGVETLLLADGSAAQVGVVVNQLVITEKTNVIETFGLTGEGAVTGSPTLVTNIPVNVNTPFGLVTRGNDAYVTIAHANEMSLVRNGTVLTVTSTSSFSGPQQMSPCWVALDGPFLYASNSPSHTLSTYAVYGPDVVPYLNIAATLNGAPTDIASKRGLLAVIDGNGPVTHLSTFSVDEDGNLSLLGSASINGAANGVGIVDPQNSNNQ
jgi:hypothetical protein